MNKSIRILMSAQLDLWPPNELQTLQATFEILWMHQTETSHALLQQVALHAPSILVIDLRHINGIKYLHRITDQYPCLGVITIQDADDTTLAYHALYTGARGCLPSAVADQEMVQAINAVYHGGTYICEPIYRNVEKLTCNSNFIQSAKKHQRAFSENELYVLQCICQEMETTDIAAEMNVSICTIEAYRERLYEKTGAKQISGVVMYALRNGFYRPGVLNPYHRQQ